MLLPGILTLSVRAINQPEGLRELLCSSDITCKCDAAWIPVVDSRPAEALPASPGRLAPVHDTACLI